jgi:hypothetical protein
MDARDLYDEFTRKPEEEDVEGQAQRTRAEYVIEGLRAQLKLSPSVIFMIFDDIAGDPSNGFFDRPAVLTTAAFAHISRRSPATDISGTI